MSFWKKMMNWIGGHASFESSSPQWRSSAGDNVMSKIWNDWTGNTQVDKSLQAQSAENEKTRQYNLSLAKLQNKWNLEQWNRENAYNSPSAQKARMQAAGLNPDMMYGGGVSNTASASPQMTSGAPAESVDWSSLANKVSVSDSVSQMLSNKLLNAQIDNINADTDKKGAETSILSSDASFRDAWNRGQLDSMNSAITLQGKQVELTDQQILESQSRITQINAQVEQLNASVKQIHNSIANDNARLDMEKLRNSAEIKLLREQCNLTKGQADRLINEWEYLVREYNDGHDISVLNQGHLRISSENLEFEGKMNYGAFDKDLSLWENAMRFLNQLTRYASPFVKK